MEDCILIRSGIRRHRGSLAGIMVLLFLTSVCLCTVWNVYLKGSSYVSEEMDRAGFGGLTAWVSGITDAGLYSLAEKIGMQEGVAGTEIQKLVFTEYEGNGTESDSEGQLLLWRPADRRYRFFQDNLSGYRDAPKEIGQGEVYVSPSMVSVMKLKIGDTVTFPVARGGKNVSLAVAGYYEDPFMGSSMIGMKGFLVSESVYDGILETAESEGMDALARSGAMIHIRTDPEAGFSASDISRILNENTDLPQYTEFVHSSDAIKNFMLILQNAFCGMMAAFALVLFGVALVVLDHSISGMIGQEWKNLGILKALGFTGKKLSFLLAVQYAAAAAAGLLAGILAAGPAAGIVSRMTVTASGMLVPDGMMLLPCAGVFAGMLLVTVCFTLARLRHIYDIAPVEVIRGIRKNQEGKEGKDKKDGRDGEVKKDRKRHLNQIQAECLAFHLAVRQLLSGKRQYAGAFVTAAIFVFFSSLAGRMNGWLGPDGRGMMDAFNPADLDIGVQVMGNLETEIMEQTVMSFSGITDSYLLAMPDVAVNGTNYTANVISEPERFHISRGKTCRNPDETVLTETAASDLGVTIGDRVTIRGNHGMQEFTVSGIYHCANDMGANLGMNREGYLAIGQDTPEIWCHHYFLADASQKPQITEALERMYGGDVHVHENSWPGLSGILAAMHMLLAFMYVMSAVFICFVTVQAGSRILDAERRDLGIYKSVGCCVRMLRMSFSLRFGIAAFAGAVPGTIAAVFFTDPLVSAVMRVMGISNFSSHVSAGGLLFPGAAVILLFMAAGYLVSGKMKKEDMSVLTAES